MNPSHENQEEIKLELAQPSPPSQQPDALCLNYTLGVKAWKRWALNKSENMEDSVSSRRLRDTALFDLNANELNYYLCVFLKEARKPNGEEYAVDSMYYFLLSIQQYLYKNGRIDNIFHDHFYKEFTVCLDKVVRNFSDLFNDCNYIMTHVEEEHLWECKQLGACSPEVLVSTLLFFSMKYFELMTVEEHMQLSFSRIMKCSSEMSGTRYAFLRFLSQTGLFTYLRQKEIYPQQMNVETYSRCPVQLYDFYLAKCPQSVKTSKHVFYLRPERCWNPDSPIWYSKEALSQDALEKMFHRFKMVKEINVSMLASS